MNNLKLTLATTLSALALTFAGAASANSSSHYNNYDNHKQKDRIAKVSKKHSANKTIVYNNSRKSKTVKRVVRHTPKGKVVIAKTIYKKPAKARYVSNKRFTKQKRYNRMKQFEQRKNYKRFNKRHQRFVSKRAPKHYVYKVRSGDTLIQVAFKTGVSIREIARLNRFKNGNLNYLRVGQILKLS